MTNLGSFGGHVGGRATTVRLCTRHVWSKFFIMVFMVHVHVLRILRILNFKKNVNLVSRVSGYLPATIFIPGCVPGYTV